MPDVCLGRKAAPNVPPPASLFWATSGSGGVGVEGVTLHWDGGEGGEEGSGAGRVVVGGDGGGVCCSEVRSTAPVVGLNESVRQEDINMKP